MKLFKSVITLSLGLIRQNIGILMMLLVASIGLVALTITVIGPAYSSDSNQLYSSSLGSPSMQRKLGKPLPVKVAKVETVTITDRIIGEGICASKPVLVPIVPMASVKEVYVEEGEQVVKGQLLAWLDDSKIRIKYESAKLAVSTALAELERVRLGSTYILAQERPEMEKINVNSVREQYQGAKEKLTRFQRAYDKGVVSKIKLLEVKNEYTLVKEKNERAKVLMKMAESGVVQSKQIAENAVADAKKALAHREKELEAFKVYSPATGIMDRVLINEGEYNQDSGKPGFLIAKGLWFEAFLDQSDFSKVKKGLHASISLESYPGVPIGAVVEQVKPIVSFHSGGPEISRPLRPRGSGSPEWAATFKVKIAINSEGGKITPGMTGFVRLENEKRVLTVPRAAMNSIAAGKGVVYVVTEKGQWKLREVTIGKVNTSKVEVLDGISAGERVIVEGHWGLKENDRIKVVKD